ncbi:hypothetical protein GCM10028796_12050 [Ramlibacter monticola]|uniref:TRAP transporter small permease protein n=1 Tax=Ramlibacter monticola TaxID=1926872 RepID=A0A936YVX9_9BURK|nr:TRAP transporter small permease [Ramlibacter monticola]MBL0390058.1 TRAP transporter small permease subunit [Ramlibacter monticola]
MSGILPVDGSGIEQLSAEAGDQPCWHVEDVVATVCMALLMLITLANVVVRYFSEMSFAWTEEVSVIVMVLMVFAGAAGAAIRNQHIRIDLFSNRGSQARQRGMALVSLGATVVVFATLAVLLGRTAFDEIRYEELNTLNLPRWWVSVPEALLCALVAVRALGIRMRRAKESS